MPETLSKVVFRAELATRGDPVRMGNDTGKLNLEIPKDDLDALLLVAKFFEDVPFRVTIEPDLEELRKRRGE